MSHETSRELPASLRDAVLPLDAAHELLWRTANLALANISQRDDGYRNHIGEILGHHFDIVGSAERDSAAFQGALPEGEVPSIVISTVLASQDSEMAEILDDHRDPIDGTVNPFHIADERLSAIYALDLYLDAAYQDMLESQQE